MLWRRWRVRLRGTRPISSRRFEGEEQLNALEEFRVGTELLRQGQFVQAVPLLARTLDICSNMGVSLSAAATYKLAIAKRRSGQFEAASALLKKFVSSEQADQGNRLEISHMYFSAAICELLRGSPISARELAHKGILLCESQQAADVDTSVFVDGYTVRGLSCLFAGEEAVDDLQRAARLAYDPFTQLVTMCNLGSCHYLTDEKQEGIAHWNDAVDEFTTAHDLSAPLSVDLLEVYSNILCNLALSRLEVKDTKRASELLSSALKGLEQRSDEIQVTPCMGRVLTLIARSYHLADQAVTAEGLYRSAIDKFDSNYTTSDPRYIAEHAHALIMFGQLLQQWDKREVEGANMELKGQNLLDSLPRYAGRLHLDASVHL